MRISFVDLVICIERSRVPDRTNISIAGLQISREYGLGNQRLGWIFSAFRMSGYAGFQLPAEGRHASDRVES